MPSRRSAWSLMIRRIINRLFKASDFASLYQTAGGIKAQNQLISSDMFSYQAVGEPKELSLDDLRLGWDGLRDCHTLLGRRLVDGPHLCLMRALTGNEPLMECEYLKRIAQGTLDFRPPRPLTSRYVAGLKAVYARKITSVRDGSYAPVKLICVGGERFILDGKHTAALCASLGLGVRCVDATGAMLDSFYWWVYRKMLRSPTQYKAHIRHFETMLSERQGRACGV